VCGSQDLTRFLRDDLRPQTPPVLSRNMANNSCNGLSTAWTLTPVTQLSDEVLLAATTRAASEERHATATLLSLLAEVDVRKLYLGEGCSSLFVYCTRCLRLSEPAAYTRITAARASRRFPGLLSGLASGELTLTAISLLAAHLTDENHETLLDVARHASKREIEQLVAGLHAQPDIPSSVRKLSADHSTVSGRTLPPSTSPAGLSDSVAPAGGPSPGIIAPVAPSLAEPAGDVASTVAPPPGLPRPRLAPIAVDRYLLRVTISGPTRARLDRARDLLRHTIPNGDPAAVIDRALIVLVDQLERRKLGRTERPDARRRRASRPMSRHVPAWVRRAVWARDEGRCAFVGVVGRCGETGFLEYHHVIPFSEGGATNAANIELRCRAHNAYEATIYFGGEGRVSNGR
jgi:hypothetical protein